MPPAPAAPPPAAPVSAPAPAPARAPAPAPKAPAAAPAPKPAAAPKIPDKQPPADYMAEYENELDSLDDRDKAPRAPHKPAAKPGDKPVVEPPKVDDNAPPVEEEQTPADEDGQAPAAVADPNLDAPEPVKIVDLRNGFRALKKQIKEQYKPEVAKLQSRVKELEEGSGATKELSAKMEQIQKRNKELEDQITFVDYSHSEEFQTKFVKPYNDAYFRAVADFGQLRVRVPAGRDPETGEEKVTFRPADDKDLIKLANMSLAEMDEEAEAMFGRSAPRVIRHVEKVRELAIAQQEALDNASKNAETRRTENENRLKLNSTKGKEMFDAETKRLTEKYPRFFAKDDADPEGNELLEKGLTMAKRIFMKTPENAPKTAEEAVRLHALAFNKIANHDRLARKFKQARARIAELEKTLKEFEDSEPTGGRAGEHGRGGGPTNPIADANAELDALDKL